MRSVGRVQLVFSTMKPDLKTATPDDVKILMTNAVDMSLTEVIELYSLRWQIESVFREGKEELGLDHWEVCGRCSEMHRPGCDVAIVENSPRTESGASGFTSYVSKWLGPP